MSSHSGCTCQTAAPISPEVMSRVDDIIARHKDQAGALMPVLQEVQEAVGFLRPRCRSASPPASISRAAKSLG